MTHQHHLAVLCLILSLFLISLPFTAQTTYATEGEKSSKSIGASVTKTQKSDENGNDISDAREAQVFRRGDVNGDSSVDISDPVMLISHLRNIEDISCLDAADVNDNGNVNIVDLVHLLLTIMDGAPKIPAPGPMDCGPDPTKDALDCVSYDGC